MGEDIDYFKGSSKWLKYDIIILSEGIQALLFFVTKTSAEMMNHTSIHASGSIKLYFLVQIIQISLLHGLLTP